MKRLLCLLALCAVSYSQTTTSIVGFFLTNQAPAFAGLTVKPPFLSRFVMFSAPVIVDTTYKLTATFGDGTSSVSIVTVKPSFFTGAAQTQWMQVYQWEFPVGTTLTSMAAEAFTGVTPATLPIQK